MEEIPNVISVITIVVDPDDGLPRIDLGSMSPIYAYTILKTCTDALYSVIPPPTVIWNDEVIADFADLMLDDDDYDD